MDNKKISEFGRAEAEKLRQLAELGKMLPVFAHELSTPLSCAATSISVQKKKLEFMFSQINSGQIEKSEFIENSKKILEISASLSVNIAFISELVSSYGNLGFNVCNDRPREYSPCQVVHDVLLNLRPKLKRTKHKINVDIDPSLFIHSDPNVLTQVLINLINNSLIHGFQGNNSGTINIEASLEEQRFTLTYCDNGVGIAVENRPKVFNKYYSTRSIIEGSKGVGLYIVKELVESKLGGKLTLEPKADNGVRFNLVIPKCKTAAIKNQTENL